MGYYVYLQDSKFHIARHNIPAAHQAIIDVFKLNYQYKTAKDFVDMVDECFDWYLDLNDLGDINRIAFPGGKFRDNDVLFETLAPYITKGSFIELESSEGDRWRWVFDGEKLIEQEARIVYDPFPWEVDNVLSK